MTYRYTDEENKPHFVGIAKDFNDTIFACDFATDSVYNLDNEGKLITIIKGGGLRRPWGCHVDGKDNLLVANFMNQDEKPFGISYFDNSGKALSPSTGFTLKTGGDQVLLPDGSPLYNNSMECHLPLMKQTGINVDGAGNVWVCNNWKPTWTVDAINPGGDGIVIFIGLAKPINRN
jgi:sugar lactone lactonase YvrE